MSRESFESNVRLRGAAAWVAYGAVEALFAIMLRRDVRQRAAAARPRAGRPLPARVVTAVELLAARG